MQSPFPSDEPVTSHVACGSDLDRAVDAFLANPRTTVLMDIEGQTIDVGSVVRADEYASRVLSNLNARETHRRMAVRTAILLAKTDQL